MEGGLGAVSHLLPVQAQPKAGSPAVSLGDCGEEGVGTPGKLSAAWGLPLPFLWSQLSAGAPGAVGGLPNWSQAAPGGDPSPARSQLWPPTS